MLPTCKKSKQFRNLKEQYYIWQAKTKVDYKGLWEYDCYLDAKMMETGIRNSISKIV